jgi:glycogen debranching enzyme
VMIERLYDPERGLFLPVARHGGRRSAVERRPAVATIAALTPLALPDLPEEIGHRLAAHLLDERDFRTPVAPPSVSIQERSFARRDRALGGRAPARYWRGPTWVNTAWLCSLGLRRLGYEAEAEELAGGLAEAILREGLREYYDPFTGAGMGARDFGWSTLILEMISPKHDC